ncbi:MAG: 3'-5' exonuclease [Cocleimonas sp.]|nr:3'-5' exonuclease [Cocleimonas sp.]
MNVLVFKIETIPDIEGGKAIFDLQGLDDKSTVKAMMHIHQQKTGSDFLPLHLHKVVAISVLYRGMGDDMDNMVTVKSLGDEKTTETELLNLFFDEMDTRKPEVVSWNGANFYLPVLRYRALKHSITLPHHWREDPYFSDIKGLMAGNFPDPGAPLNQLAKLLGFPSVEAKNTWDEYQARNWKGIQDNCELDVLKSYLIYLRYLLMDGQMTQEVLEQEFTLLRDALESQANNKGRKHLGDFLKAW